MVHYRLNVTNFQFIFIIETKLKYSVIRVNNVNDAFFMSNLNWLKAVTCIHTQYTHTLLNFPVNFGHFSPDNINIKKLGIWFG